MAPTGTSPACAACSAKAMAKRMQRSSVLFCSVVLFKLVGFMLVRLALTVSYTAI
jgi:hypothetical protein